MLIALIAAAVLLEHAVLPGLEDERRIACDGWMKENKRLRAENALRNQANQTDAVWRSKQFPVDIEKGKPKRILVMGDSFVWGDGYANVNDMWWRQLERELIRRGYNDVEVIAAGHCGYATHHELDQAKKIVPIYKPDLIVWSYAPDDVDEGLVKPYEQKLDKDFEKFDQRLAKIAPNIACAIKSLWYKQQICLHSGNTYGYKFSDWVMRLLDGPNFERYQQTAKRLLAFQSEENIPGFMVAIAPWPSRQYFEPRFAPVRALMTSIGFPYYDALQGFCAQYGGNQLGNEDNASRYWSVNPANPHPGPEYMHFYALQVATILEQNYRQCLGDRSQFQYPGVHINDYLPVCLDLVEEGEGKEKFQYPASTEHMLYMPVRKPFVQLNLAMPVSLSAIGLSGTGLKNASIYLTGIGPQGGCDDTNLFALGNHAGSNLWWHLDNQLFPKPINTIRISADVAGKDRVLHLSLVPERRQQQLAVKIGNK